MIIVNKNDPIPQSIYLCGPATNSFWMDDAVDILKGIGYDGVLYLGNAPFEHNMWEHRVLGVAAAIAFWIPSDPYPSEELLMSSPVMRMRVASERNSVWGFDKNEYRLPDRAIDIVRRWQIPLRYTMEEFLEEAVKISTAYKG